MQDYVERYAAAHEGRDPFTECWPRASGLGSVSYLEGNAEHLVTAIAESMRLAMARYDVEVGDLEIDQARDELTYWIGGDGLFIGPRPGELSWPAPKGARLPAWKRLFLESGPVDLKLAHERAEAAFTSLFSWISVEYPNLPSTFGSALKERRNPVTGVPFFIVSVD